MPDDDKWQARSEFLKQFQSPWDNMICLTYSTVGLKADCDFMLWRIAFDPLTFQSMEAGIRRSRLGAYLLQVHSFLSLQRRSPYVNKMKNAIRQSMKSTFARRPTSE